MTHSPQPEVYNLGIIFHVSGILCSEESVTQRRALEKKLQRWYDTPLFPIGLFLIPPLTGSHTEIHPIQVKHAEFIFQKAPPYWKWPPLFTPWIRGQVTNPQLIPATIRIPPFDNKSTFGVTSSVSGTFITPIIEKLHMSLHPEITYVKLTGNFPIYPLSKIQEACLTKWKEFLIKLCNSYSFRSLDRYVFMWEGSF